MNDRLESVSQHALDCRAGPVCATQVGALDLRQPHDDLSVVKLPLLLREQALSITVSMNREPDESSGLDDTSELRHPAARQLNRQVSEHRKGIQEIEAPVLVRQRRLELGLANPHKPQIRLTPFHQLPVVVTALELCSPQIREPSCQSAAATTEVEDRLHLVYWTPCAV